MFGLVLSDLCDASMEEVRTRLESKGIETRAFFVPLNKQPAYDGNSPRWPDLRGSFPVSERLGNRGLYLPTGLDLTRDDQRYIVAHLKDCLQ